ncbi:carboxypeptidase-like regulatory domain-containing protein [archaeon]
MSTMKQVFLFVLMLVAASASLIAVEHSPTLVAGEEQGYVIALTDADTGAPLAGALVEVHTHNGFLKKGVTGDDGSTHFFLTPEAGEYYAFRATADGYNEYVVVHDVSVPEAPEVASVVSTATPVEDTSALTGFIVMNSSQKSWFFFWFSAVIVCLFGASYVFYFNFVQEHDPGKGLHLNLLMDNDKDEPFAWDSTRVIQAMTGWMHQSETKEEKHNSYINILPPVDEELPPVEEQLPPVDGHVPSLD